MLLSALLLYGSNADAAGIDTCAHHGVSAVTAHEAVTPADAATDHSSHHAPVDASSDASSDGADDGHSVCTCIGMCAMASAVVLPQPHTAAASVVTYVTPRSLFAETIAPASSHLDLLPYGIAPPSTRISAS